ncbi:MAG TPA: hypothetical protein VJK06_09260 [Methyloceanibacter sp.]|nr:hypothetical protein [Methyloceanibacter sp.]
MAVARKTGNEGHVNIVALGWGLTATLVALFVICALAAMLLPTLSLAHNWLGLFSTAPAGSLTNLVEGAIWNIVFAWFSAVVFGLVYNRLVG